MNPPKEHCEHKDNCKSRDCPLLPNYKGNVISKTTLCILPMNKRISIGKKHPYALRYDGQTKAEYFYEFHEAVNKLSLTDIQLEELRYGSEHPELSDNQVRIRLYEKYIKAIDRIKDTSLSMTVNDIEEVADELEERIKPPKLS